jgi:hypothetical protein
MPNGTNLGVFTEYENGKHRRYSVLFSVNGGAFAIAQLLQKSAPDGSWKVGHLTLHKLSWGLCLFTIVMVFDIYKFGEKMRKIQEQILKQMHEHDPTLPQLFGRPGKVVLLAIGVLICAGWFFAGIY